MSAQVTILVEPQDWNKLPEGELAANMSRDGMNGLIKRIAELEAQLAALEEHNRTLGKQACMWKIDNDCRLYKCEVQE